MTLASVFTSFSSYRYSHSVTSRADGANARAAEGDKVPADDEGLHLGRHPAPDATYKPQKNAAVSLPGAEGRTQAASTILSFIGSRLKLDQADGADAEALAGRFQAGLDGFVEGFTQAYEQLQGMGFLTAEVEAAIEQTFTNVLDGLDSLADELGLDSQATEALRTAQQARRERFVPHESETQPTRPRASLLDSALAATASTSRLSSSNLQIANRLPELLEAASLRYEEQQQRSFSFSLTTRDGDEVQIRAAFASSALLDGERVPYGDQSAGGLSGRFQAQSGFYLDIQGELDEGELEAITGLLDRVREVSDLFFAGDIDSAFERALELGFDDSEIAQFSLQLNYRQQTRAEAAYTGVRDQGSASSAQAGQAAGGRSLPPDLLKLAQFVEALVDLRERAQQADAQGLRLAPAADPARASANENSPVVLMQRLFDGLEKLNPAV